MTGTTVHQTDDYSIKLLEVTATNRRLSWNIIFVQVLYCLVFVALHLSSISSKKNSQ